MKLKCDSMAVPILSVQSADLPFTPHPRRHLTCSLMLIYVQQFVRVPIRIRSLSFDSFCARKLLPPCVGFDC